MSFALRELLPPSSVTAAAMIPAFTATSDVLAVARGNRLFLYPIEGDFLGEPFIVHIYGTIMKIIPLNYLMSSDILVILDDLRSCSLRWDDDRECVETISVGNLTQNMMTILPKDIKITYVPSAVVVQLHAYILTVFPIVTYSQLGKPFPIQIPCKSIIDFAFIGPISKVTRLAVLTEEIADKPKLHLIELDISKNSWTEDQLQTISLPEDTYLLLPYQPDTSSTLFCFSSLKATSVTYAAGIAPQTKTHTIFTPNMLKWYAQMKDSLYVFVDEKGSIRVTELNENAKISFIDLVKCNIASCIVPISSTALFVGSKTGVSHLYQINNNSIESLMNFDATDAVIGFEESENTYAICESATMRLDPIQTIQEHAILSVKGLNNIWCKPGEEGDFIVASSMTKTFFLEGMDGVYDPVCKDEFITEETSLYIAFDPLVQVTPTTARFEGVEIKGNFSNAASNDSLVVLIETRATNVYDFSGNVLHTFDFKCNAACVTDDCIALTTNDSVVFYNQKFEEVNRVPIASNSVSIAYDGASYIIAHTRDIVTIISGTEHKEVPCPGYHTIVQIIHHKAVVFGEIPVTFIDGNRVLFGSQPLMSGYGLNEEMLLVSRNGLILSQEGKQTVTHFAINNVKSQIQCLKKIQEGYLMSSGTNICFAKSITDTRYVFYQASERVDNILVLDDLYVALTAHQALCFVKDSLPNFKLVLKETLRDVAASCGVFQNLFYIAFNDSCCVKFYVVENGANKGSMEEFTSIKTKAPIKAVASQGNLFAIGTADRLIRVFEMNDHSPKSKEVGAYKLTMMDITALAFINTSLIVGTSDGVICIMSMEFGPLKKMKIIYASQIGTGITAITRHKRNNGVLVGTSTGQVFEVIDIMFPKRFDDLYSALESRLFSAGHFNKLLEHSVVIAQRILTNERIVDIDLLIEFLNSPKEVMQRVLNGTEITTDEAIKKINIVIAQIGKIM